MPDPRIEYWDILNDLEDLVNGGVVRSHSRIAVSETDGGALPRKDPRKSRLDSVAGEVSGCEKCQLCRTRTNTVPGTGVLDPLVMFVGEGPGADEDRTGLPFVGRAGQYLDKWLAAIGLDRSVNCFIGNIVKCRPPGNRDPEHEEIESCLPYLYRQIDIIRPKVIVTLGRISSQILCGSTMGIGRLRGGRYDYLGIPIVPTYHPSGVLRNPEYRAAVWEDLKSVQAILERDD
jgi:DNA polymerase